MSQTSHITYSAKNRNYTSKLLGSNYTSKLLGGILVSLRPSMRCSLLHGSWDQILQRRPFELNLIICVRVFRTSPDDKFNSLVIQLLYLWKVAMKTRLQARQKQTSSTVASSGIDSPRRYCHPLQGKADVAIAIDQGGSQATAACGEDNIDHQQFRDECQKDSTARGKHLPEIFHRTRCATCCIVKEDFEFRSTITGRKYYIINKRDCELDCTTDNLIYLIECTNCHIQYIGETSQPLSGRFSDHKSRIRNHNATKKDTLLIDHFNNGMDYSVNIIETIQQPAKIGQMLDQAITTLRRKTEDFWMEELHIIYPYGLNNHHGNNQDQQNEEISVRTMFQRKAKKRKKCFRRSPHIPTKTAEHIYDLITGTF